MTFSYSDGLPLALRLNERVERSRYAERSPEPASRTILDDGSSAVMESIIHDVLFHC